MHTKSNLVIKLVIITRTLQYFIITNFLIKQNQIIIQKSIPKYTHRWNFHSFSIHSISCDIFRFMTPEKMVMIISPVYCLTTVGYHLDQVFENSQMFVKFFSRQGQVSQVPKGLKVFSCKF